MSYRAQAYCETCSRSFVSGEALDQHERNSNVHTQLWDYATSSDEPTYSCDYCDRSFDTANARSMHEQVHSRRDIVCWGCNQRSFATYSAMLIHTESGKCTVSQVWLDECSERCYQSKKYVVEEFRTFLRKGERPDDDEIEYLVDQGSGYGVWECVICQNQYDEEVQLRQHIKSRVHDPLVYECPSCDNQFRRLSALVQHVEKGSCSEGLREGSCSIGKMLHYIHVRLDLCDAVLEDGGILIN
ncbi:hypothetical protein MMC20_002026 [Loxospora ochrophaea]|nr:hypothetical protein [Loxospora ochrophaea]